MRGDRDGRNGHRWVQTVKTVSTFPPPGTFTRPGEEIARVMADPAVSPRGLGSAVAMVQYFINRAGRRLAPERRQELERAKELLQEMKCQQASAGTTEARPDPAQDLPESQVRTSRCGERP